MAYKRVCLNCGATCDSGTDYCFRCSGSSRFVFSLFADCIYRSFVRRKIKAYEVGTSRTGVIAACFISEIVFDIALIITLIVVLLMGLI